MSSASGVVGLFAPSAISPAEIRGAFSAVIWLAAADGARISQGTVKQFGRIDRHAARESFHRAGVVDVIFQARPLASRFRGKPRRASR